MDLRYSHTYPRVNCLKTIHRRQLSLREKESDFFPMPIFFLGVSSVIADITRVFAIRASCFYISRENLGEASQACYESTLISGTSFFSQ